MSSHFAHIENGVVTQVIVIKPEVLAKAGGWYINGVFRDISEFVETSPKALEGKDVETGENALRKNFASIGYTYDKDRDAFIPPKPVESDIVESSVLDEEKGTWVITEKERPPVLQQIRDWITRPTT